ncbi:hypothetical protein FDECE_5477 [Fusarium decemcellulare]|nr:hypothetical protein FDECE_5477 [Fusarium decemcellulare]
MTKFTTESLTPLDLLMPRTYVAGVLTFRTTASIDIASKTLQNGLDALAKQLPFLSGHVLPTSSSLEIRYSDAGLTLVNKGSIETSYESLAGKNMPPSDIPTDVWPFSQAIDEATFKSGAPVFGASVFRFSDGQGIGLCICIHHNMVDGTGFGEVLKLWTRLITTDVDVEVKGVDRLAELEQALGARLVDAPADTDALFAKHPEYSKLPPAFPGEFPSCTSKVLAIPISRIDSIKSSSSKTLSTNTIVSALLWASITRARLQRNPDLATQSSRLATAVNGRRRIDPDFSMDEKPYLGNVVMYALADVAVQDLSPTSSESVAKICEAIASSQASDKIDASHIAEVYKLVTSVPDYRAMFPGWDLFSSRDLTITSWADLDIYNSSFGPELGKPEFARVPYNEADGVGMILPRKRGSEEKIEVMVMLRRDDMEVLEKDEIWT